MLSRGDGLPRDRHGRPRSYNLDAAGKRVYSYHLATPCQPETKPSQTWNDSHIQFDHGRNDGFVRSASGPVAMGYWTGDDLPFYYGLAQTFPLLDRYFSSCLAQTYPNRRFSDGRHGLRLGEHVPSFSRYGAAQRDNLRPARPARHQLEELLRRAPSTFILPGSAFHNSATSRVLPTSSGTLPRAGCPGSSGRSQFREVKRGEPAGHLVGEAFAAGIINAVMQGPGWDRSLLI